MAAGRPAALLLSLAAACGGDGRGAPLAEWPGEGFLPRVDPPARVAFQGGPAVLALGAAVALPAPAVEGGAPDGFEVAPPLPAGLALDPATGAISGTPAALAAMTAYAVTARNAAGAATGSVWLAVLEPGALWLAPGPLALPTRWGWQFQAGVAGGGELAFEATAGEVSAAGAYEAPWYPGPVTVRAFRPGVPGAEALAAFEVQARSHGNVELELLEPASGEVSGDVLQVTASIRSRYQLVAAEVTLDGATLPLNFEGDGLWHAAIPLGPGPHLLRVAGIDFAGSETELFRELVASP